MPVIAGRWAPLGLPLAIAFSLMAPLFVLGRLGALDFWWSMSLVAVILCSVSFFVDRGYLREIRADAGHGLSGKIGAGLLSAVALFLVFFFGNLISRTLLPFAGSQINHIYELKSQAGELRIFLLMAFIIGPGEEIFWRGFVQKRISAATSRTLGFAGSVLLYTGVHLASANFMLIGAAFVCGLFWSWLYQARNSITVNIISHTAWDLTVFLWLPFTS